jgi:hypothetical protein
VIEIQINNQAPADFTDFLVGAGQPAFDVSIRTTPDNAPLRWTITPLNNDSGRVNPNRGTTRQFSFTPNVRSARRRLRTGSRQPNAAVGYRIEVVMTPQGAAAETLTVEFEQDEHSILRQEYLDFGATPPARADIEAHDGDFNVGNYSLVLNLTVMQTRFNNTMGNYRGRTVRVNGQNVAIPQTATVTISSGYRNPRRNVAAGSQFPVGSRHVWGRALDLVPDTPVTVRVGNQDVTLGVHRHLYPALQAAAATQGTAIAEDGPIQVPLGSTREDHIHLQW